jgi:thiamine pyrophosphate-dependent acetolactate synthase large subunit-like protein
MPLTDFELSVRFEKVVESVGGIGLRVENPRELPAMLRRALRLVRENRTQVLLNVICERDG